MDVKQEEKVVETGLIGFYNRNKSHIITVAITLVVAVVLFKVL